MNRRMTGAFAALCVGASAHAQSTWDRDGYRTSLLDCVRRSAGEVACTFTSTFTGTPDKVTAFFPPDSVMLVNPDGKIIKATSLAAAGGTPTSALQQVPMYRGQPVKLIFSFPYGDPGAVIPRLEFFKQVLSNVTIRGSVGSAPAPARVASGTYDVQLSGCTPTTAGGFTCTGAVVTPRK